MLQKEEKKENKMNFEGTYLRNGLADSAKIWNWRCLPDKICTAKFICFSSGTIELQMHENGVFFTPVKYTLVCCAPGFLGHTTHYQVS